MNKIEEIVLRTRRTGNTTWLLKSAIENPDCIIVSRTMRQAKELEKRYNSLLQTSSWYKKLWWKIVKRKKPKFVSLDFRFEGLKTPVIFDNSSF
jgi:hypothetical protein